MYSRYFRIIHIECRSIKRIRYFSTKAAYYLSIANTKKRFISFRSVPMNKGHRLTAPQRVCITFIETKGYVSVKLIMRHTLNSDSFIIIIINNDICI